MGNLIHDLDPKQESAFLGECASVRNLLGYGVKALREGAFLETTLDPVLTMLSIGLEKLHKLSLGSIAVDVHHEWPNKATMKAMGHGSEAMHATLMAALRDRRGLGTDYTRGLVAGVEADPVIDRLLAALDVYGRYGRFYYLDLLGDSPQDWVGPDRAWTEVENAALLDPDLGAMREAAFADLQDQTAWATFERALRSRAARGIEDLWVMITACGVNHMLGRCGEVLGFEASPAAVGRQ